MADATDALASFEPLAGVDARERRYTIVDVFAREPLGGNPLAVFDDGHGLDRARMQQIAREMNLSETLFLLAPEQGGDARVRIFTPTLELPFAGHPVLGTAALLAVAGDRAQVTLETGMGPVAVELIERDGMAMSAAMSQPIPEREPFERAPELLRAVGIAESLLPVEAYVNGPRHVYVTLADEDSVAALRPDLGALAALGEILVSCFSSDGSRVRTRMFAPAMGVAEDPATGSAAGPLAVHLARHGRTGYGEVLHISQGSEIGRPSQLRASAHGSAERIERVEVSGWSVIAGTGRLAV
jgi:trans-2,3-dihydro-3-hydroxyanthranilate isomerase